ncbi:GNAT family N-acetyltransferase [Nioella aestuarii]|uniref:GNAT family N-acetyltransferase n=1 Tax=Nioella aestuarii TaxID=1662864 RepID=UPI003D7FF650
MTEITIHRFRAGEGDLLGQLFHRSVHEGAAGAYDAAQRAAWSPEPPSGPVWEARLAGGLTLVAWTGRDPVGFMMLIPETGHLDLAFVAPEMQGQGVAAMLYGLLERSARRRGLARLTTDASELARGFFLKQGWQDGPRRRIERHGIALHNYPMAKSLKPALERAA